ncbi:MAG: adenylate kinase [Spirochaetales bacterium]
MKFVFLGPPGAGKGTLASVVSSKYDIPHISTGEIFREAIRAKSPLGLKVKSVIDSGALVSDDMTVELVKERLSQDDVSKGFILDGFPRTIIQAEALATIIDIDAVINFEINDEAVIKRISGRRMCKGCPKNYHVDFSPPKNEGVCDSCSAELYIRDDDTPHAVTKRLEVYRSQTAPLIDFYKQKNILQNIDASPAANVIVEDFIKLFPI